MAVEGGGGAGGGDGGKEPGKEKARKRCDTCKKKVPLTSFSCRCGGVFCGEHRYPNEHACSFDYRAHDRGILQKAHQKVVADKVDKL